MSGKRKIIHCIQVSEKIRVAIDELDGGKLQYIDLSPSTACDLIANVRHSIDGVIDFQIEQLKEKGRAVG